MNEQRQAPPQPPPPPPPWRRNKGQAFTFASSVYWSSLLLFYFTWHYLLPNMSSMAVLVLLVLVLVLVLVRVLVQRQEQQRCGMDRIGKCLWIVHLIRLSVHRWVTKKVVPRLPFGWDNCFSKNYRLIRSIMRLIICIQNYYKNPTTAAATTTVTTTTSQIHVNHNYQYCRFWCHNLHHPTWCWIYGPILVQITNNHQYGYQRF